MTDLILAHCRFCRNASSFAHELITSPKICKICRFCWHHIKENLNGRCPACRSLYSEQTVQFVPISHKEIARIKKEKKVKEKRQKEMDMSSRKHLSNTRVVQKNLMYVLGLTAEYANEEVCTSNCQYFAGMTMLTTYNQSLRSFDNLERFRK